MRSLHAIALSAVAFAPRVLAGTVCMSWGTATIGSGTGGEESGSMDLWPIQGNPCESDADNFYDPGPDGDDVCAILPRGVNVCGQNANLVKVDDGAGFSIGHDQWSDCGVRLEINGQMYDGKVIRDDNDACDIQTCRMDGIIGLRSHGSVAFEDLPICAPAGK